MHTPAFLRLLEGSGGLGEDLGWKHYVLLHRWGMYERLCWEGEP